jgi:hypothetical protein
MAIQLNANEIVFLYEKMVDNITYVKVREVQAPTKADKEMYSKIYTTHIASHKEIDWNCASCVVDAVGQIYRETAPFADKLKEAKAELKAATTSAKKAK